jgi:hypothetical protein
MIDQLEMRFVEQMGYSSIAESNSDPEFLHRWTRRLQPIARVPETPERIADAPYVSLTYAVFEGDNAAVVYRYWNPSAKRLQDYGERHPLVARALVGPESTLSLGLATALCLRGLPSEIGTPAGQANPRERLDPISWELLERLADNAARDLDQRACGDPGLAALIATALKYPRERLSVILPPTDTVKTPSEGRQAPLVWGLHRITGPLLAAPAMAPSGWSFSTYEAPYDNRTDSRPLPLISFRREHVLPGSRPAMAVADHRVELADLGGEDAREDEFAITGSVLAIAYRELGFEKLSGLLWHINREYDRSADRLNAVRSELREYDRPAPVLVGLPRETRQDPEPVSAEVPATPPPIGPEKTIVPARNAGPEIVLGPRDDEDLFQLLGDLDRTRGEPAFDVTFDWIAALVQRGCVLPAARIPTAYERLQRDGWYVRELEWDDPAGAMSRLDALVRLCFGPDFGDPHVVTRLRALVGDGRTPAAIICAVARILPTVPEQAAISMQQELLPYVRRRYTVHSGTPVQAEREGTRPDDEGEPDWMGRLFRERQISAAASTRLMWVVVVETVILIILVLVLWPG